MLSVLACALGEVLVFFFAWRAFLIDFSRHFGMVDHNGAGQSSCIQKKIDPTWRLRERMKEEKKKRHP